MPRVPSHNIMHVCGGGGGGLAVPLLHMHKEEGSGTAMLLELFFSPEILGNRV